MSIRWGKTRNTRGIFVGNSRRPKIILKWISENLNVAGSGENPKTGSGIMSLKLLTTDSYETSPLFFFFWFCTFWPLNFLTHLCVRWGLCSRWIWLCPSSCAVSTIRSSVTQGSKAQSGGLVDRLLRSKVARSSKWRQRCFRRPEMKSSSAETKVALCVRTLWQWIT